MLDRVFYVPYLENALKNIAKLPLDYNLYSGPRLDEAIWYWRRNYGRHHTLYMDKIKVHGIALLVNVLAFFLINLSLQGTYFALIGSHWPFSRDYLRFSDPLSSLFPPFTLCETSPKMQLWMGRTERVGCHLPLMEVYEKLFLAIWVWQILLALATLLNIAILCFTRNISILCSGVKNKSLIVHKFRRAPPGELLALARFNRVLTNHRMNRLLYAITCEMQME